MGTNGVRINIVGKLSIMINKLTTSSDVLFGEIDGNKETI